MKIDISDEEIQAAFKAMGRYGPVTLSKIAMRKALKAAIEVRKARKKARKQVRALSS